MSAVCCKCGFLRGAATERLSLATSGLFIGCVEISNSFEHLLNIDEQRPPLL
jgi:hypothetical protein